jgi:hypothetical protein
MTKKAPSQIRGTLDASREGSKGSYKIGLVAKADGHCALNSNETAPPFEKRPVTYGLPSTPDMGAAPQ